MVRHLVTIDDLSETEIQAIFTSCGRVSGGKRDSRQAVPRNRELSHLADDFILATTLLRSQHADAVFRSKARCSGWEGMSSRRPIRKRPRPPKGETIADTIRVLENYADAIVIRHPCEGSIRVAADYADVPIINAGDGGPRASHATLCDPVHAAA